MPVFTPKTMLALDATIKKIASGFFGKTPLRLTGEEFVSAFVNPDHLQMLRDVQDLFGQPMTPASTMTNFKVPGADCGFRILCTFTGAAPISVPPYAAFGLQPSCPAPLMQRIDHWVQERYRLGLAFGDAADALFYLNETCGDMAALRLVFPAIVTVMGKSSDDPEDKVVKKARTLTDQTKFGKLPKMTPEQRARVTEVAAIVNSAALVGSFTPEPSKVGDAVLSIHTISRNAGEGMFQPWRARSFM